MSKSLLTLLLFLICLGTQAQSEKYRTQRDADLRQMKDEFYSTFRTKQNDGVLDVLEKALPQYQDDKIIQAWKHCMKAQFYADKYNADSAIHYFERSANTLEPGDDEALFTRCKTTLSNIYAGTGRPEQALQALQDLKKELTDKSDPERFVNYYSSLGGYYKNISDYKKGAESYFSAIEYINKLEEGPRKNVQLATAYNDLASVLTDKDQAVDYHKKARKLVEGDKQYGYIVHECDVLIVDYKEGNSTDEELKNIEDAITYYHETKSIGSEINGKMALAKAYNAKGEIVKAEGMFLDLVKLSKQTRYREGIIYNTFLLGNLYYEKGEYEQALPYLLQTIDSTPRRLELSLPSMLKASEIYKKRSDFKNAYAFLERYRSLEDSVKLSENKKAVSELESKYQSEKKEQEIRLLQAQTSEQRSQRNLLIGGIIFTTLSGLFFFMLYRNRQKTTSKLQELDASKSRFFENISHEFRTPLTLIKLPISKALKSKEALTTKQLNTVHNNASRLQSLVEDLLTLSELDADQITASRSQSQLFKQISTSVAQFDSYAGSKGIDYTYTIAENHVSALYDRKVVEKVLSNLISNAIKYCRSGNEINVDAYLDSNNLIIKVADNGTGITEENQKKVFDRFYQVESKDEGIQGSGIGLALVKKLLELNNGDITLKSQVGKGSTFQARLPLDNIQAIQPHESSVIGSAGDLISKESILEKVRLSDKAQLLIVEDNGELLDFIKELFDKEYDIHTATDGKEGWKKAQEVVPDFIISDWMMPKMNGIDLCEKIKTSAITSHIPFMLLTAKSNIEDKVKGYNTGADAYFSKPFNFDELQAQIKNLIKQRKTLLTKYSDSGIPANLSSNKHDIAFWESFKDHLKAKLSDSDLSAASVANAMQMSRMQLHRKLKAITGQTISTIIKNQRMILAASLLEDPSNRISEICYSVGFNDNSSFSRTFKKEYGMSPTQFREQLKKKS